MSSLDWSLARTTGEVLAEARLTTRPGTRELAQARAAWERERRRESGRPAGRRTAVRQAGSIGGRNTPPAEAISGCTLNWERIAIATLTAGLVAVTGLVLGMSEARPPALTPVVETHVAIVDPVGMSSTRVTRIDGTGTDPRISSCPRGWICPKASPIGPGEEENSGTRGDHR